MATRWLDAAPSRSGGGYGNRHCVNAALPPNLFLAFPLLSDNCSFKPLTNWHNYISHEKIEMLMINLIRVIWNKGIPYESL
jgi:hypothetical protein